MKRPTAFEKMRRNRRVLERAAAGLAVEREFEDMRGRFLAERAESFEDTRDWLVDTLERAKAAKQINEGTTQWPGQYVQPRRGWLQRLFPGWSRMAGEAAWFAR